MINPKSTIRYKYLLSCIFIFEILSLIFYFPASAQVIPTAPPVQNNLSVSALVWPQISDFQFTIFTDASNRVSQNQSILYEITYGAYTTANFKTTNTIVVNFGSGRAPDGTYIADYVIGSASKAYEDTPPVVDLKNRTITWTLPELPAGTTDQKVTFRLMTNSYTGSDMQDLSNRAGMSNEYVTIPDKYTHQKYLYDPRLVTPAPTPTAAASTPAPTAPPVARPAPLRMLDVYFTGITDTSAAIAITTSRLANHWIRYGTSPESLDKELRTSQFSLNSGLQLTDLTPGVQYYFRITAADSIGFTAESDLLTFTTAKTSQAPDLINNAVFISSGNTPILSQILNGSTTPFGILTTGFDYQLTYIFNTPTAVIGIETVIRRSNSREERMINMSPVKSHIYTAPLRAGSPGMYDIFVRISTPDGHITEQKIARVKIIEQLVVLEEDSLLPIGDAHVVITNDKDLHLAGFTDGTGELRALLPPGTYHVEVNALGYDGKTVEFTIDEADGQEPLTILLSNNFFNISGIIVFLKEWIMDLFKMLRELLHQLAGSIRLYNSTAYTILLSGIVIGFLLFRIRTDIRWRDIVTYFVFNILSLTNRHTAGYLYGIATSGDNVVSGVLIEVIDLKTGTVLSHAVSNRTGRFTIRNTFKQQLIKLQASKEGFAESEVTIQTNTNDIIRIDIQPQKLYEPAIVRGIHHTSAELFELILLLSLFAELVFLFTFGILKTLPFFTLSIFNLILWLFYLKEKKQ